VVENAYRDDVFFPDPATPRDRELLFVGRLVSDKGADLLLRAMARLADATLFPGLTVVGDGPERQPLARLAAELGIAERVRFAGMLRDGELAEAYRHHLLLVVPSRYEEPFGVVALEGIACGCAVVGSAGGGLPRAIGPCGLTFPNGDVIGLAAAIRRLLERPAEIERLLASAPGHLALHEPRRMLEGYRTVLASAVGSGAA
jgi:glycosyltransferase involved in cell wall biosynthesis